MLTSVCILLSAECYPLYTLEQKITCLILLDFISDDRFFSRIGRWVCICKLVGLLIF